MKDSSGSLRELVKVAARKGLARIQDRESSDSDPQPFFIVILAGIAEVLSEAAINRFGAALKASMVTSAASTGENEEREANNENA